MRGTARRFIIVFAMATMLASVATGAAVAARRAAGPNGAKITFEPLNPPDVAVGEQYLVNASGFRANTWVAVSADGTWWGSGITNDQGRVSITFDATRAGETPHKAYEQGRNGRLRLKTSATLTVLPAQ